MTRLNGFGLSGNDNKSKSAIVESNISIPVFTEPTFNTMVIYEMHVGTFNNTITGAVQKLDYLQNLGINCGGGAPDHSGTKKS